jgi:hypothetical protein
MKLKLALSWWGTIMNNKLNTMEKLFEDIAKIYLEFPCELRAYIGPKNVHHTLRLSKGSTYSRGSWRSERLPQ